MSKKIFLSDSYDEYGVINSVEEYLRIACDKKLLSLNTISLDLLLLSEVFEIFKDKELWLNIIYKKLEYAKHLIATYYYDIRLFGGLLDFAVALKFVHDRTGFFLKPLETINKTITPLLNEKMHRSINAIESLTISDYDLIAGATGLGIYLLYMDMDDLQSSSFHLLETYFSKICTINNRKYGWFIKYENQLKTNEEMEKYKLGHYDCGAAHGIAGPLFVMSKMYKSKYFNRSSLETILDFYKSIEYKVNDVFTWPGKVPPFNEIAVPFINLSWCYGYTGIFNSLLTAYTILGHTNEKNLLLENSIKMWQNIIVNNSMSYLRTLTLCHGYSGVLCGMTRTFKLTDEKSLLNNIALMRCYLIDNLRNINNNTSLLEGIQGVLLALLYSIRNDTQFESLLLLK